MCSIDPREFVNCSQNGLLHTNIVYEISVYTRSPFKRINQISRLGIN